MKIYNYLIAILICLFVFPNITKADCDYERQAELSKIASNVNFSYTYEKNGNGVSFIVNAINIADDIYVKDSLNETISNGNEFNFKYDTSGQTIEYEIYSKDPNCYGEKILSQNINLPTYNSFSDLEDCGYFPEFKYCQRWLNTSYLTQEKFDKELDTYKNNKANLIEDFDDENTNLTIIDYIKDNALLLIICIISLLALLFLIRLRRRMLL